MRFPANETRQFGKYSLLAKLGHGGMADVFLAVNRGPGGFDKLLVIKRLKPEIGEDPEFRTMFQDEGRLAARLNHANIVQSNEIGEIDGHAYLAMEYLEGQPLNRVNIRGGKTGPIPLSISLRIVADTLAGLHYAHELSDFDGSALQIVHRDVSPHNIFVTYDGVVKVVDFGIAKSAQRSQHTSTGVVKGKISYMAPEQALCAPVDRRADVFSVGVMLWELACGQRFWADLSEVQILKKMAFGEVPSLAEAIRTAPPELVRICEKALSMVPDDRYSTAEEFRQDVEALAASLPERASSADVGAWISELFADRKAEAKSLVQERMAALEAGTVGDLLELHPESTLSPSTGRAIRPLSAAMLSDLGDEGPVSASGIITTDVSARAIPGLSPRRSWRGPAVVGVALLIAGGGAVAFMANGGKTTPSTATPPASAPPTAGATASSSAAVDLGTQIALEIRAAPANAVIYVDDARAAGNPFVAKLRKDGMAHTIRVEADGYETHTEMVAASADVTRSIELVKVEEVGATGGAPSTGTWKPPPGGYPTATPPTSTANPGVIETDPWGQN